MKNWSRLRRTPAHTVIGPGPPARSGTRLVLLAGFAGFLGLMALATHDSVRALRRIEARNARITRHYLNRHRFLGEIRSAFYLSSSVVRGRLMAPDAQAGPVSLASLRGLRARMEFAVREYAASIRPGEQTLLAELQEDVGNYWSALAPMLRWTPQERKAKGHWLLETEAFPRREATLAVADRIAALNEQALSDGARRSAELFMQYRRLVTGILELTLGLGVLVAGASIRHILRLARESLLLYDQLRRTQGELKQVSARLLAAQGQEPCG